MPPADRATSFGENPLASDSPETWERLLQSLGPASMLVCIEGRLGPRLAGVVTAEDVWQETLLHVWRDRARYEWRGPAAFRAWVLQVAENRIRHIAERASTLRHGAAFDPHADVNAPGAPPIVRTTTPSQVARDAELAGAMRATLEELDEEVREVVRLRLFEGVPVEAVAEELGLGVSAVKHRFRKGAATYQARLERQLLGGQEGRRR